jgi:hypothetical protein
MTDPRAREAAAFVRSALRQEETIMHPRTFDTLTKGFAMKMSRRTLAKSAAALAAASFAAPHLSAAQELPEASALVQSFYESVDAYQYADAYAMLGSAWQAEQSRDNFVKGYHNTAFVQCDITGEETVSGGTSVKVKLISWHNDGKIQGYTGHYTVGEEGGDLRILAGDNTPNAAPGGTPRLCRISDLSFRLGAWDAGAGNRFSSVVATNTGEDACVLGGSPRVTLTDASSHELVSTSEAGSAPTGITVQPGEEANASLRFANWCEGDDEPFSATVEVPGDTHNGTVDLGSGLSLPPCLGEGEPALLGIRGWEAGSA